MLLFSSGPTPAAPRPPTRPCLQGPAAEVQQVLPGAAELDLSSNLVSSWAFVAELAAALPGLHTLNLSGNRLALPALAGRAAEGGAAGGGPVQPAAAAAPLPRTFPPSSLAGLQTLVLNGCGVAWQQAVAVAQQLPNLRELHLCSNGLSSLQLPGTGSERSSADGGAGASGASAQSPAAALAGLSLGGAGSSSGDSSGCAQLLAAAFPQLEVLDLEGNALASWDDVAALGALPRLRSLLLSGNQLADVRYSGGGQGLLGALWTPVPEPAAGLALWHRAACGAAVARCMRLAGGLAPPSCLSPRALQASLRCARCCWAATGWPAGRRWMR